MTGLKLRWAPLALAALLGLPLVSQAADHRETSRAKDDPAADIADVYAWHNTASGLLTVIVTYGGGGNDGHGDNPNTRTSALYDKDVLYTVHIDNTDDSVFTPNKNIYVRFGQNNIGEWGVKVEGLPGADGDIVGAVGTALTSGSKGKVQVGLYDDPFFFDLDGFKNTLNTGTLGFQSTRDSFAGKNVMAIVLQMDLTAAANGGTKLRVWADTGRKAS
ncbi:MAG: DUF4331 family protein [Candidatus Eisenbacteria bacterium]